MATGRREPEEKKTGRNYNRIETRLMEARLSIRLLRRRRAAIRSGRVVRFAVSTVARGQIISNNTTITLRAAFAECVATARSVDRGWSKQ